MTAKRLFADWSAQSAKDVPEFTAKTWDGFHPTFIGAGTIYHHAIANGWSPDPALVLNGSIQMNGRHPAKALLEKLSLPSRASGNNSGRSCRAGAPYPRSRRVSMAR